MLYSFFEAFAKIAPAGLFSIALGAIFIAFKQLKTARQNEAKKQYLSYLDDCIKNPKMAMGVIDEEHRLAYTWFLNKSLLAHESIYEEFKTDKYWKRSIIFHLRPHVISILRANQMNQNQTELDSYSEDFQKLIISIAKDLQSETMTKQEDDNEAAKS